MPARKRKYKTIKIWDTANVMSTNIRIAMTTSNTATHATAKEMTASADIHMKAKASRRRVCAA